MNWKTLLVALLLPYWLAASNLPVEVLFLDMGIPQAQQRATQLNKPLLVYFSASWCMPCQWMESNTFADADLASFINTNYIAVKVDMDEVRGSREMDEYQVKSLPTLLVFSASGRLLVRQESSVSADRLMQLLSKHQPVQEQRVAASTAITAPVVSMDHLNMSPLIPATATASSTYAASAASTGAQPTRASYLPAVPQNTYRSVSLDYFVVQTGAFADYQGAMQSKREAEQRYQIPVSILEDTPPNRSKLFKVHVGHFLNEAEAAQFLLQLNSEGVKGFVVKRTKL